MAHTVTVKALDGKQDSVDETLIDYRVDIPSDILFHTRAGIIYASWWKAPNELISVPASQIVSIE